MAILGFVSVPGGAEWFVVLLIALLLFGKRLPEVARSMGKSINEFKIGLHTVNDEVKSIEDQVKKPPKEEEE